MAAAVPARQGEGARTRAGLLLPFGILAVALAAQAGGMEAARGVGLVCFAVGLAHGAGDEGADTIRPLPPAQAGAYLIVGAAVAAAMLAFPLGGLALFLALSAWHFAVADVPFAFESRAAAAALAVGGSALVRPAATADIFAGVIGGPVPPAFVAALAVVGAAGFAGAAWGLVTRRAGGVQVAVAASGIVLLDPVPAVGVLFLVAHALPVGGRQVARHGLRPVLRAVTIPTAVALAGAGAAVLAVGYGWIGLPLAAAVAIGMATPHMLTDRLGP